MVMVVILVYACWCLCLCVDNKQKKPLFLYLIFIAMAAVCVSVEFAAYFCGVFGCGYCSRWMEFKLNLCKEQKIWKRFFVCCCLCGTTLLTEMGTETFVMVKSLIVCVTCDLGLV